MSGKLNLTIEQGATFRRRLTWKAGSPAVAVNLTGCTARLQMRNKISDAAPALSLTTENGGIVLGGAAGTIDLEITAAATAALTWKSAVYDLEIILVDASVKRLVHGAVEVTPEVTR